jgi:hypothetical protein
MATTTPNYGWPVPTSTDYVKDGATAIEALGDAIDATVFGLGSSPIKAIIPTSVAVGSGSGSFNATTGLVTFSGASSISLNGVFSNTYTKYQIVWNAYAASATTVSARMRASGTDNTSTTYNYAMGRVTSNGNLLVLANSDSASTIAYFGEDYGNGSSWEHMSIVEVCNPFQSKITTLIMDHVITTNTSGSSQRRFGSAQFAGTTSFDGITMYGSANLTGTVKVMGYV